MDMWTNIKKTGASSGDIYALLGTRHQYVSRWRTAPASLLTKRYQKYRTIILAQDLFGLSETETEAFANKAGLSLSHLANPKANANMEFSTEIFPYDTLTKPKLLPESDTETAQYTAFAKHFNTEIEAYPGKLRDLYEAAFVSERMLRYIRAGTNIKKEPILAILITMGKDLDSIQKCLRKAGLMLSKSLPVDMVVMWLLENEPFISRRTSPVSRINETLESLGLPQLMTRPKN